MSQIDKIIYIPLLLWFIILFIALYLVILGFFTLVISTTVKTRILFIKNLSVFLINMAKSTELDLKSTQNFLKLNTILDKKVLSKINEK